MHDGHTSGPVGGTVVRGRHRHEHKRGPCSHWGGEHWHVAALDDGGVVFRRVERDGVGARLGEAIKSIDDLHGAEVGKEGERGAWVAGHGFKEGIR
ncbi:hypothetical protein H0H81_012114 [Sphagnurus paluster]|uniref:Uncharacterized protein n=1 Tax=Sphagnurus paluster TaxID=117069 RepID=A0A9P7GL12_9AGAR|nr:hypothetical protein H0H81_012114 [Sphagnurus paluster]